LTLINAEDPFEELTEINAVAQQLGDQFNTHLPGHGGSISARILGER